MKNIYQESDGVFRIELSNGFRDDGTRDRIVERVYGTPEEAVTYSKMKKICKTFCSFCLRYKIDINRPIRFDVIAFSGKDCITHYENAFEFVL